MTGEKTSIRSGAAGALQQWTLAAFVVLALLLGGGGSPSPVSELALQLGAACILAAAFAAGAFRYRSAGRAVWTLAAIAAALPLAQLVPLPPALWQSLPGRGPIAENLALVGGGEDWRAFSIAPAKTLASLLAIIPPVGLMLVAAMSPETAIRRALWAIVAMALLSAVVGGLQVASDGQSGYLYTESHRGWVTGFFANRNAAADLFLIALAILVVLENEAFRRPPSGSGAMQSRAAMMFPAGLLLLAALLMTGSRTGIVLLAGGLLFAVAVFLTRAGGAARTRLVTGGFLAVAMVGIAVAGWMQGGLRTVAARFSASDDLRAQIWPDAVHAAGQFWPAGSGVGTFREAFGPSQSLETVGVAAVNRAHNDYLELAIEGGAAGLVLLLLAAIVLARAGWMRWQAGGGSRGAVLCAAAIIAVLALHSLVDYPLRSMALASVFALGAGILAKPPNPALNPALFRSQSGAT